MKNFLSVAVSATVIASAFSSSAYAAGCGGTVNIAKWGCAPWDNNDKNGKPIKAKTGLLPGQTASPEIERKIKAPPNYGPTTYTYSGAVSNGIIKPDAVVEKTSQTAPPAPPKGQQTANPTIQGGMTMKTCPIPGSLNGRRPC